MEDTLSVRHFLGDWKKKSLLMWRAGVGELEEKATISFLAIYRLFGFIVAGVLLYLTGYYIFLSPVQWILIGIAVLYAPFTLVFPFRQYRRPLVNYAHLSADIVVALALPVFIGGLHSPFLLYSLSPFLAVALLLSRRISISIAILPGLAALAGEVFVEKSPVELIFLPEEMSFRLLAIYVVGPFLMASLPYMMNRRVSQKMKERIITEERKRLSRDMHDGMAQTLGMVRWKMEQLSKKLSSGYDVSRAIAEIAEVKGMVEATQREAREMIAELRATGASNRGFTAGLAQYVTEFTRSSGIKCELHVADAEVHLPPQTEREMLRVVQEALTNVRKHASASKVQVSFRSNKDETELVIKDNGCGFAPGKETPGYGLIGMAERVKAFGGELAVNASPGCGVEIMVTLNGSSIVWPITK